MLAVSMLSSKKYDIKNVTNSLVKVDSQNYHIYFSVYSTF